MVNLSNQCCLEIDYDIENNSLMFGEGVTPTQTKKVSLQHLLPTLLNKSLIYPKIVYEEHAQVGYEADGFLDDSGLHYDLVSMPAGLLGIEFVKSHIYHTPESDSEKYSIVVEVIYGALTIIMQKNSPKDEYDFDTSVEEGIVVELKKGEKLAIPVGYFYTFVNAEDKPVLFVKVYKKQEHVDYETLRRENGLAYYCIRKNARREIVHNPLYRKIPKIKFMEPNSYISKFGIDELTPLYSQVKIKADVFAEALWE